MSSKAMTALGYDDEAIVETIADVRERDVDRLTRQAEEARAEAADAAEIKPKPLRKRRWRKILRRSRAVITKV